ncbi:hypothetical protein G3I71_04200 [Streptomyces sp. SID12501]|uniref:Uncharacterized protein n=1 Tax=Streptomyces sp. SID12501 TaxID=2706042 RepID=A0A6B3BMG7_9ACTN|nr:hypothetical protein [Streptomyces sp. SID12501]
MLLARDAVRGGHVRVDGLTVAAADLRGRFERPHGWAPGFIEVQQGGFTLWNMHTDPDVTITAELLDIAAGSADHPIRGTGVLVGGHGVYNGSGGKLAVTTLRTGEVHADSGIVPQTFDLISGGVFVVSGAEIRQVTNAGTVVTYGANQPVFDNWGDVGTWTVEQPITSHGPSGVGFVQFGSLDLLDVRAPITTMGPGGRGFNLYDGTLQHAVFDSITTHGDGGVGIVVSKPLPLLEIRGDLTTLGGEGYSLYYGVQVPLKAAALDVKQSGSIGTFRSDGGIVTKGDDVITVVIEGEIGEFSAKHGIAAEGAHSDAVHVRGTVPGLDTAEISARDGRKLVRLDTSHPMVHG